MWKKAAAMSVREAIGVLAGPRGFGDTRESWLARASRKSGIISFRMMRSLWNGEIAETTNHWAVHTIKRQADDMKGKAEAARLASIYDNAAEGLRARDADFHRNDIAALVRAARILRGDAGAGVEGT
jgi:hypothetical protein